MTHSSAIRLGLAALSVTAGCLLWWSGVKQALLLIGAVSLIWMPTSELKGPVPRRELWLGVGLLALLMVSAVAVWYFVPGSTLEGVERISRHPAVVLTVWLFLLWGLFRQRRRQGT